jgi:hypothetical protein
MERRAMSGVGGGTVIVSIDLELEIDQGTTFHEQRLDAIRAELIAGTTRHRIQATWAVADPLLSAASDQVLAADPSQELAVLGDRTWIGYGAGRARLARELARRFIAPRKLGIPVSTLALRNVEQVFDLDLLLDHGVTALRGPAVHSSSLARKLGTPAIRFGIWQATTAWRIPLNSRWRMWACWQIRRKIRQAINQRTTLHLAIDASQLVESRPEAMQIVGSTLRYISACRDAGRLQVQTLGRLAAMSLADRTASPSRSILRPAA